MTKVEAQRQQVAELGLLRQLEAKLREAIEATAKKEERFPEYLKSKSVPFWSDTLKRLDEFRANGFKTAPISKGQATEPNDRTQQNLLRRSNVAKLQITPEIEAHTSKAVAAAVKAEQKRVAEGLKAVDLPEGTTARQSAAIMKAVKAAIAPAK